MAANDANTEDLYCPFCGFNPPCGCCMMAVQKREDSLTCAIAAISIGLSNQYHLWVKNIAEVSEHGGK